MKSEQITILKQELDKQDLSPDQWQDWLEQASQTCFALAEMLRQTEPYAHSSISMLKEVEETLLNFAEEE